MSLRSRQVSAPLVQEASLRRLILKELNTSQLSSFVAAYYPAVYRRFTGDLDDARRLDLWFALAPLPEPATTELDSDWKVALLSLLLDEYERVAEYLQTLGPEDFVPSPQTCSYLIDCAFAALALQPLLTTRCIELETLRPQPALANLQVGLLGITSSGKSALLNAVMGAAWLPEDPLPTTRVPVVCAYGPSEGAAVYFASADGSAAAPPRELSVAELQAGQLTALCDERARPQATRAADWSAISSIALASPYAELLRDARTVLVDTPGLDAEGYNQHHLITMNEVLPTLDLVLYLKPVLAPFKAADLELLNAMVGNDQPVLMLLTKIDTVHDELEATAWGGLTIRKSALQLIEEATRAAEAVLAQYPRLARAGVLPVSALWAKQVPSPSAQPSPVGARLDELKARSGLLTLENFLRELGVYKPALKAQRVGNLLVRLLGRIAEDLQDPTSEPTPSECVVPDDRELEIRALVAAHAEVAEKLQAAKQRWRGDAGKLSRFANQAESMLTTEKVGELDAALEQLFRDAIGEIATLRNQVQQSLENFGRVLPPIGDAEQPARQTTKPATYGKLVKGEWFWENPVKEFLWRWRVAIGFTEKLAAPLGLWRANDTTELNTRQLLSDIRSDLDRLGKYLDGKLAELEQGGLLQLRSQLDLERSARKGAEELFLGESALTSHRERTRKAILRLQARAQNILTATPRELPTVPPLLPAPDLMPTLPPTAPAALRGLLYSVAERSLQLELLTTLGRLSESSRPKVLLLGSDRRPILDLVARLLHRSELQDTLAGVPADHWIRLENQSQPAPVPVGARTWDGRQLKVADCTILSHLTLVVAPADEHLAPLSADFLRRFDAVGIYVDAAQLGSGLADLARAGRRYVDALQSGAAPTFLISGQGSTLEQVLDDLLLTIPAAVEKRFPRFTSWLVYSGYDARYSRFVVLGQKALAEDLELVKLWEQNQLSFAAPFSPDRLRRALSQARRRRRAVGQSRTESPDEPR